MLFRSPAWRAIAIRLLATLGVANSYCRALSDMLQCINPPTKESLLPTTLESLEVEVLRLPPEERSRLLDRLIDSLDSETTIDKAWDEEAARRDAEIESGQSVPVDGREVIARLKAQIK